MVSTFNCRSVKNSVQDIRSLCDLHDVILLQETWLLPHDLNFLNCIHSDFLCYGTSAVDTSEGVILGRPFGGASFSLEESFGKLHH